MLDEPEFVAVEVAALNALLQYVVQIAAPMGRDSLVQAVVESARPVGEAVEPEPEPSVDEGE